MSDQVASPAWSCFRKKAYPTEDIASKVARRIASSGRADVVAYGCTSCGLYHIGRRPKA